MANSASCKNGFYNLWCKYSENRAFVNQSTVMKQFLETSFTGWVFVGFFWFFCRLDSPLKMTLWSTIDGTNSERQVSGCCWITSKALWWPLWCEPEGTDHLCCFVQWWFVNQENKKYNMASSKPLRNHRLNSGVFIMIFISVFIQNK